jgi:hypothetical protein
VEISERSRQLLAADTENAVAPNSATHDAKAQNAAAPNTIQEENADATETEDSSKTKDAAEDPPQLTQEEQEQVNELKDRDREVRAHEQAHLAAAGGYARGGPSYEYQRGPDGQRYAVGGHVNIDTAPVPNDPEATIRKAQTVRNAANAPAEPSSQDRSVAAQASRLESQARQEISAQRREESNGGLENKNNDQTSAPEETTSPATDTASSASTTPATDATTAATGTPTQAAPVASTANTVLSQTTGASTQTAPGRFGRSSESVGQLLQLLA